MTMTTFEEMESAWKTQSAKLNQATLLLTDQMRRDRISRIQTPLRRLIASQWGQIALCAVGMLIMGDFVAENIAQTRYVWPALLLDIWLCATLIAAIRQLLAANRVNYDTPISGVQEQLAALRILRLKTFRWLFLSGQVVWWMPFLITSLKMFFGVDAYRFLSPQFIWMNMLVGLVLIPLLPLLMRRIRFASHGSWYGRLCDVIAGESLADAQRQARAFADFTRETTLD